MVRILKRQYRSRVPIKLEPAFSFQFKTLIVGQVGLSLRCQQVLCWEILRPARTLASCKEMHDAQPTKSFCIEAILTLYRSRLNCDQLLVHRLIEPLRNMKCENEPQLTPKRINLVLTLNKTCVVSTTREQIKRGLTGSKLAPSSRLVGGCGWRCLFGRFWVT